MQTTQHTSTLGKVLLHPACTTSPDAVRAVQQATGQLVVLNGGKPQLGKDAKPANNLLASGATDAIPLALQNRRFFILDEIDNGPFGGNAA